MVGETGAPGLYQKFFRFTVRPQNAFVITATPAITAVLIYFESSGKAKSYRSTMMLYVEHGEESQSMWLHYRYHTTISKVVDYILEQPIKTN